MPYTVSKGNGGLPRQPTTLSTCAEKRVERSYPFHLLNDHLEPGDSGRLTLALALVLRPLVIQQTQIQIERTTKTATRRRKCDR